VALGLILFDGGLRTRLATFRNVLGPAGLLATVGVLVTAGLVAPVAAFALNLTGREALLVGAVMASTDAAAVFFLLHAKGLRLRPRVSATLEVESGINDPFAIFLTIVLVEILFSGEKSWSEIASLLIEKAALGALIGWVGGRAMVAVLNRMELPQGLHAPFIATGALVTFGLAERLHGSGFLAVYVAGLVVGNRETRAHGSIVTFLDAATWLAQIAMFVLLGLLAWPERLPQRVLPALAVALALMLVARPVAVFLCLTPFRFSLREKLFMSWVGLRGAVSVFLASIPMLVGLPGAHFYFDVAFVVVMLSLAIQGWTIAPVGRWLRIGLPRPDVNAHRTELDLPGTLKQELVGYPVVAGSPYLRRGISPSWAKLTLVVRDEHVLTPEEAAPVRERDHVYFLAPPERVQALDRFFAERSAQAVPDAALVEDFFVPGDATLGALAEIYGLTIKPEEAATPLSDYFAAYFTQHPPRANDAIPLGPVKLVAHTVTEGRVVTVGLQLAEPEPVPRTRWDRIRIVGRRALRRLWARLSWWRR
jgi:cell volume regulation protein A